YFDPGTTDGDEDDPTVPSPREPLIHPSLGPTAADDDATFLRLQGTYAGAVTHLDTSLEQLLDAVQELGLDQILWIITSDYGLPLGEPGIVDNCRPWLHDELIHIPLIVRLPGRQAAGLRVAALTQSVDLMPTLLEWFGLPMPPSVHGQGLLPLIRGEVE